MDYNYIFSWSNIIKRFILNPERYKDFKETCLKDLVIAKRLSSKENEILLNFEDIEQHVHLHAEMNIVANIIERNYRRRTLIAVSKSCCYLY